MRLIKKFPLLIFFILAYGLSWALWVPICIVGYKFTPTTGQILIIIGGFGPLLSAILVTFATKGKPGFRELKNHIFKWRVRPIWYLLALFIPIIVALISYGLYVVTGGESLDLASLQPWYNYFPALLFVFFLGGGQEELGWRGFALPKLQTKYGALIASIILGVLWAFWHLPLFLMPISSQSGLPIFWYLLHTIAISIVMTWIYNNTKGSVLLTMIFHAGLNAVANWIPISATEGLISQFTALVIIEGIVIIFLVCYYGPFSLSRTRREINHLFKIRQ